MAGAQAPPFLGSFCGTTEQLGEKGSILERDRHQPMQGLKPDVDFIGFIGTTEVVPCYRALHLSSYEFFSSLFSPRGMLLKIFAKLTAFFSGL
ncbi:MAG: hypothetical protein ABSE46_01785 [Terracidiphilus sp.]